jgi:hypothetical protein
MKTLTTLILLLSLTITTKAQKYGFAYAYHDDSKTLYISNAINLDGYPSDCPNDQGYGTSTKACVMKELINKVIIKEGSKSSEFSRMVITQKNQNNAYGNGGDYSNVGDVDKAIEEIIVEYRRHDYSVYKINL